jgi:hypothetical protein
MRRIVFFWPSPLTRWRTSFAPLPAASPRPIFLRVYKIELTSGPGWDAPLWCRGISLSSTMSLAQVEALARSVLEVAQESARLPPPDGYRIRYEGTFGAAEMAPARR